MSRRPRQSEYDHESFGESLGKWLRQIDRVRRAHGLTRGLSRSDFARDAGISPAKLSYAVSSTPGRRLDQPERAQAIAALERQILWTANRLDSRLSRCHLVPGTAASLGTTVVAPDTNLPDLGGMRSLAGLPAGNELHHESQTWEHLLAHGHRARKRYQWREARTWYSLAARHAKGAGSAAGAAMATAYEAATWLGVHDYARVLVTVDSVLVDLGATHLSPETAPPAHLLGANLGSDLALEAYTVVARVCAYRWHLLGLFRLARDAAQAGVNAGRLRQPVSYDEALADSYHFLAKALIEEVAADTSVTAVPRLPWRTPAYQDGWRWTVHQALAALMRERQIRPPDDPAAIGHSWRNTARALRLLLAGTTDGAKQKALASQVSEAMRQASRFTRVATEHGPPDPLVALYLDQARWALESRQETKRVLTPLRRGIDLALTIGGVNHASWGWGLEAQALSDTRRRGWEQPAQRSLLASLAAWSEPFESRDSAKTIQMTHWFWPTPRQDNAFIDRLFDDHAGVLDQLAGIPGFSREASLARTHHRLRPPET